MNSQSKEIILMEDLGYLYPKETSKQKKKYGLYKCFCGNEFKAETHKVNIKHTQSCGCLKLKQKGQSSHRLYDTWSGMIHRCTNKQNHKYLDYGGRGINVCERWKILDNFIEDMYPTFQEGLTLDRKDNDLGYLKDNCRWANQTIQCRNQTKIPTHNTSGIVGVYFNKQIKKWISNISIHNKTFYIGCFINKEEALKARDKYIIDNSLEHTKNRLKFTRS